MDTTVKRTSRHTQEVAALLAVQHPNIVRLMDVRDAATGAELALEHAAGGSLHDLLAARRRLPTGEVLTIGLAIAAALDELHRRGLVHGDVHPANILFDHEMVPLLADLGAVAPVGHPAAGHGVPGCTAPEVERGAPPSPASDQWSLAAMLRAALGPVVPTPLAVVLSVALAPVPADRYPSIESMATALRHAAPAAPVQAAPRLAARQVGAPPVTRRYGPLPPAARRSRARARRAYAVGLFAVALLIGAVGWPRAGATVAPPVAVAVAVVAADGEVRVTLDGVEHRYRVGEPGDVVLVGDWDCDGLPTIGLYRPRTGRVLEFGVAGGAPAATAELTPNATAVVTRAPAGCDTITVMASR